MQGMTERARSLQNSPYCHAPRQCKSACHVHHPVGTSWSNISDGVEGSDGLTHSKDTYKFAVWAKPGYTFFVRMGARVDDTFQMYNYSDIVKIEVPQ